MFRDSCAALLLLAGRLRCSPAGVDGARRVEVAAAADSAAAGGEGEESSEDEVLEDSEESLQMGDLVFLSAQVGGTGQAHCTIPYCHTHCIKVSLKPNRSIAYVLVR